MPDKAEKKFDLPLIKAGDENMQINGEPPKEDHLLIPISVWAQIERMVADLETENRALTRLYSKAVAENSAAKNQNQN